MPCQDTLELTAGFGGLRSWLVPWTQALGILCGRYAHIYPDSFPSVAIETPLIRMQIFLSFSLWMLFLRQLLFSAPQWDSNVWPKRMWNIYVQAGSTEQRTLWVEMIEHGFLHNVSSMSIRCRNRMCHIHNKTYNSHCTWEFATCLPTHIILSLYILSPSGQNQTFSSSVHICRGSQVAEWAVE